MSAGSTHTQASADAPLDCLEGKGGGTLGFDELDQDYQLKIRSMIRVCMPPVFSDLERRFDLKALRAGGTIPVMFFLQFETYPQSLAFGGALEVDYRLWLRRSVSPPPPGRGAEPVQRLLFDMDIAVNAEEGAEHRHQFGAAETSGRIVPAARMRGAHVITRPLAPPDRRQVTEVPAELAGLAEHAWEGPFPTVDMLGHAPEGYTALPAGDWQELRSVWALHNTDINQHVNVQEYITALENHYARQLFAAGLPVARHRIARTDILFRRPSFMGESHAVRGQLYVDGNRTVFLGGVYRVLPDGNVDAKPSVFTRMEGELSPAG